MCYTGLLKRFLPFLLTLAAGLFIASFFVDLTGPRFGFRNRGFSRYQHYQQLKNENQRLRADKERLTEQLEELRRDRFDFNHFDSDTLRELPPPPPPAPIAPRRIR